MIKAVQDRPKIVSASKGPLVRATSDIVRISIDLTDQRLCIFAAKSPVQFIDNHCPTLPNIGLVFLNDRFPPYADTRLYGFAAELTR